MNTQSSTFCVMPWIHQNLSLPNNYKPCCNADSEYKNITAQTTSVLDAFHSGEASTLRQQLDNNENPEICNVCWNKESMGVESYRQIYNKQYSSSLSNKPVLKYIDIEFDNVCNLQCRMCSQHNSDQILKSIDLFKEKGLPLPSNLYGKANHSYYQKEKKDYIKEVLHNIDQFKVTGGEPFLSKDFLEILDICIDKDLAKGITLRITTNGTKFSKSILNKLQKFKEVFLTISIDGTGSVYNYIRYPFNWEQLNKRLLELKQYSFNVMMSCVVQAYNWLNLNELINYSQDIKCAIEFNLEIYPNGIELSPRYLPNHILDLGLERFRGTNHKQIKDFENFVNYYKTNKVSHNQLERKNDKLYETTINYDTIREQSYKTLDPVLTEWLNTLKI